MNDVSQTQTATVAPRLLKMKGFGMGFKFPDGQVQYRGATGAVKGAKASVQTEGEIRSRFTATRIVAMGPLALAFKKKKDNREFFLVIEGPEFLITAPVKKQADARAFAQAFNAYASNC